MTDEIPGEIMMLADEMILVDTHRVQLGMGAKIGETFGENGPAFFVTIEGRVNKSEERRRVELMIPAELGYRLGNEIMDRLERFIAMTKEQS